MDKVEYTEAERWLIELKPGTAATRDFGIDLSLTVSNLRLTPEERIKKLDRPSAERRESWSDGVDQHFASLLELEAILEYQQMIEAGKI